MKKTFYQSSEMFGVKLLCQKN